MSAPLAEAGTTIHSTSPAVQKANPIAMHDHAARCSGTSTARAAHSVTPVSSIAT